MASPIPFPLINGVRHGFSSIELKLNTQIFVGFKSINYSRTRTRTMVRGNHPDPIGKTRGENEYSADCELYFAEWVLFQSQLKAPEAVGDGGYGDAFFPIYVTYGENGFDTVTDEILGCTMDTTEASNGQGADPLVRKIELNPLKVKFGGLDDLAFPLAPPPAG